MDSNSDKAQYLHRFLPRHDGVPFGKWCAAWLEEMSADLHSVIIDDPGALQRRNERLSSYLATLSIVCAIYRQRARAARDNFYNTEPRGSRTVREYEEARDSITSPYRYMRDLVDHLHEDILRRISTSQTNLRVSGEEMGVQNYATQ